MVVSFGYGGIPENAWNASISKIVQNGEDYKSAKGFALITKISFFFHKDLLHYPYIFPKKVSVSHSL